MAPLGFPQSTRPLAADAQVAQKSFGVGNTEMKVLSVMMKVPRPFVRFSVLYPVHREIDGWQILPVKSCRGLFPRFGKTLRSVGSVVRPGNVVLKVRVVARLLGRDAASGIIDQHGLQEIETVVVETRAEWCAHVTRPLGEGRFEVGIASHARPNLLCRCSKNSAT